MEIFDFDTQLHTPRVRRTKSEEAASAAELLELRHAAQTRLRDSWESIFAKYGHDGECDEIDVETGEIVVDRGHVASTPFRPFGRMIDGASDAEGEEDEEEEEEEEDLETEDQKEQSGNVVDENCDASKNASLLVRLAESKKKIQSIPRLTLIELEKMPLPTTPSATTKQQQHSDSTPTPSEKSINQKTTVATAVKPPITTPSQKSMSQPSRKTNTVVPPVAHPSHAQTHTVRISSSSSTPSSTRNSKPPIAPIIKSQTPRTPLMNNLPKSRPQLPPSSSELPFATNTSDSSQTSFSNVPATTPSLKNSNRVRTTPTTPLTFVKVADEAPVVIVSRQTDVTRDESLQLVVATPKSKPAKSETELCCSTSSYLRIVPLPGVGVSPSENASLNLKRITSNQKTPTSSLLTSVRKTVTTKKGNSTAPSSVKRALKSAGLSVSSPLASSFDEYIL